MRIVVNIEYPPGITMSEEHIGYILNLLKVPTSNAVMDKHYNGAWFWIISGVSINVYKDVIREIAEYFNNLYKKGYIHYFYIGEYR